MKKFTNVFLLAGAVFISSCISVNSNSGSETTTTADETIPSDAYKVETVTGSGYFDVKKDTVDKVYPKIGKVLKIKYFDVKVNKIIKNNGIKLGVPMISVESLPGKGYRYLILKVNVTNTDKVNRKMFTDGFLYVYGNDKRYKFEITQAISGDGFGFIKEDILPSKSKTTNFVYKIADEVKGAAYFQPDLSNKDARISLGTI